MRDDDDEAKRRMKRFSMVAGVETGELAVLRVQMDRFYLLRGVIIKQ
jgi:hypothetical protein